MPLISAQLLIKSGGEVDPADLSGAADMTASLLTRGTTTRSATQIAEAVDALGGSLNSSASWDASSISTGVMSSRVGPALEILADVARNPSFKPEEIERLRRCDARPGDRGTGCRGDHPVVVADERTEACP